MPKSAYTTKSAVETEKLGAACAALLEQGNAVLVSGELGTGKTTFIRGACRALGVTDAVTSPSFVIGQIYRGDHSVAHLDLYRLESFEGEDVALLDDYITADRVSFVEWPKSGMRLPVQERLRVTMEHLGGDKRKIEIEGAGPLPEVET